MPYYTRTHDRYNNRSSYASGSVSRDERPSKAMLMTSVVNLSKTTTTTRIAIAISVAGSAIAVFVAVLRICAWSAEPDKAETDAIEAMRARGISNAYSLLEYASTDAILATCRWWDALRTSGKRVSTGLLVSRIRDGGIDPRDEALPPAEVKALKRARRVAEFDVVANRFPAGSVTETHLQMRDRRWPNDEDWCNGQMVVLDTIYPVVAVRCDGCGFEAGYPFGELGLLPSQPLAMRQPEPSVPEPGPLVSSPPARLSTDGDRAARELAGVILRGHRTSQPAQKAISDGEDVPF